MGKLMKKLTACIDVFSQSAVNDGMLTKLQKLEEDVHCIYELIRRNDTNVIYILKFVFVLCLIILNYMVLVCVAAVMHDIF